MFDWIALILEYKIWLTTACFFLGSLVSVALFVWWSSSKTWKIADLVWIVVGGVATLIAISTSLYLSETSEIKRDIDLARADLRAFSRVVSTFNARHCANTHSEASAQRAFWFDPHFESIRSVCSAAISLQNETNEENELYEFIELAATSVRNPPVQMILGSTYIDRDSFPATESANSEVTKEDFSISRENLLLENAFNFSAKNLNGIIDGPVQELLSSGNHDEIVNEYLNLNSLQTDLQKQFRDLQTSWGEIRNRRFILALRMISIFAVALAFPLRLGKSLNEIRTG